MKKGNKEKEVKANVTVNKVEAIAMVSLILFSIFAVISPSVAQGPLQPHQFRGNVTVDGKPALDGSNVTAKIAGTIHDVDKYQTTVDGKYGYAEIFRVPGDDPSTTDVKEGGDNGDEIKFYVDGNYSKSHTFSAGVYTDGFDLEVHDGDKPVVTDAEANKSIIADGEDTARLNVTVQDHFPGEKPSAGIESVTVDLLGIKGEGFEAVEMEYEGSLDNKMGVWSTTTTAVEGTTPNTYNLPVNATDKSGNSNTSVNIALEVTAVGAAPNITAFEPTDTTPSNTEGESRTFNITVNQTVNVSWQINGSTVETDSSVTEASYTNASAVAGYWNVSAIATNVSTSLSDMQTWWWTVTERPAPTITDWYNNKTINNATEVTINESECVFFNATADQAIDTWGWFVNDSDQSHNFDSFTYCDWTVNGTYYVKVTATNATNGTSSPITWTVTVEDITPPEQVAGLTNGTPSAIAVDLWWDANAEDDLVGYKVYKDGSLLESVPKTRTYCNVTGLSASTTYEFNVSAYDDNALEGENATVTVTTPEYIGPTITDWYNNKTKDNATEVTINESECAYFNATADQAIDTWRWFVNDTDQAHNFDNFTYCGWTVNGTYSIKVDAINVNGTSSPITWTVTVNDITAPAKVTGLTNDTPSATAVDLWWNASTEADLVGYKVYKNGSLLDTTANTYYNVTGLSLSTTYEFNVSAYDDNDNEGERSDGVTITTATIPVTYNLTISSTAGGNVTVPDEGTFTYNESDVVTLKAVPDAGYEFVNWTGEVSTIVNVNANETTITMNDNYTITANFEEKITYNLTISSTDGGTVTDPGEATFTYDAGTVVSLKAVPDAGYEFVNWTGEVSTIVNVNANETTITMNDNYTITANFAIVQAPTITYYSISNHTIILPQTTEIDVAFSERVEAWIKIEDSNREVVDSLYHSTGVTNPDPKTWDGTYTNGTVVPDGDYYVNVTGLNTTTGLSVVNDTEIITVGTGEETIEYNLIKNPVSTGKNWICIPIDTDITNASSLMQAIPNCDAVNRWNPNTQQSESWIALMGGIGTNFDIVAGEGYEVSVTANTTFNLTGVPVTIAPIDLIKKPDSTGKNWIGLPYNTTITNASSLMQAIPNCDAVNRWNPNTQQSESWIALMGGMGTNFAIVIGEGYEISVTANTRWTPI